MNESKELVSYENIGEKVETKFVQLIKSEDYPVTVRDGINEVMEIIRDERSITDLYPEVLAEIPISQSHIQDQAVQYDQHYTSHKKLRQAVMEMQDRLNALYAAKTGQKKAILKVERIKFEMENLYNQLEETDDDYEKRRWNLTIAEKEVDLEESERGLKDSSHLIKDALLKVHHQQNLVDKYKAEVEASGLSYEESEVVYYTMYFTKEAEQQLRTGDFNIDRGTFGAISQMPEPIRLKILKNISFLRKKLFEDQYPKEGDYLFKVYREELEPKMTGDGEFEGMKVNDYLSMETIKLLAKDKEE